MRRVRAPLELPPQPPSRRPGLSGELRGSCPHPRHRHPAEGQEAQPLPGHRGQRRAAREQGGRPGPAGPGVSRSLRPGAGQPGPAHPLRHGQPAALGQRRAGLRPGAGHGGPACARTGCRCSRSRASDPLGVRRDRLHAAERADLHQHPQHDRPGGAAAAHRAPLARSPADLRRRPGGVQPRAPRAVHGLLRHRRWRRGVAGDLRALRPEGSRAASSASTRLPQLEGVYVPARYPMEVLDDGRMLPPVHGPEDPQAHHTRRSTATTSPSTTSCPSPSQVHDRISLEVLRGCTQGCRFCQAGMVTRPVRERNHRGRRPADAAHARDHRLRRGQPRQPCQHLRPQPRAPAGEQHGRARRARSG